MIKHNQVLFNEGEIEGFWFSDIIALDHGGYGLRFITKVYGDIDYGISYSNGAKLIYKEIVLCCINKFIKSPLSPQTPLTPLKDCL